MGRDLGAQFPLDPRKAVSDQIQGYSKNMNVVLAKLTTLGDLAARISEIPLTRRPLGSQLSSKVKSPNGASD